MTTAFQADAFQNDAFQIDSSVVVTGTISRLALPPPRFQFPFVNKESRLNEYNMTLMQGMADATMGVQSGSFLSFHFGGARISIGNGSPEGVVVGSPGDLYFRKNGGASTCLYVKESGTTTNTGWVAK